MPQLGFEQRDVAAAECLDSFLIVGRSVAGDMEQFGDDLRIGLAVENAPAGNR
jgi:hypothetical protein